MFNGNYCISEIWLRLNITVHPDQKTYIQNVSAVLILITLPPSIKLGFHCVVYH